MQSGRCPSSAAGRPSPGTSPIPAPKTPLHSSRFGTLNLINAPCNLKRLEFATRKIACRAGCRFSPSRISNRHLVRLEIAASRAKSTTSLFLIVTKRPQFSNALLEFPRPSLRLTFAFPHISTVYSVQLKSAVTPVASTKLPSLMCTSSHTRATAFHPSPRPASP